MQLNADNAEHYLRSQGFVEPSEAISVHELSGGISNVVLYVSLPCGEDFVLKQARERLQVADPWFCRVERIWREIDVLQICQRLAESTLGAPRLRAETPRLLFEDRENHLYAMTAAPRDHVVWKMELLSGHARPEIAASCGALLGRLHAGTWHDLDLARSLDDREFFEALRLDPFYRQIARVNPKLQSAIGRLISSVWHERHCLVHGDFSPKNLLICNGRLVLIDFEAGHYGDPAFDLGFFLSHLILKAFYHVPHERPYFDLINAFWAHYRLEMESVSARDMNELEHRAILNFAGCALARLDGKSKVDYLTQDLQRRQLRQLCCSILLEPPTSWKNVMQRAGDILAGGGIQQ